MAKHHYLLTLTLAATALLPGATRSYAQDYAHLSATQEVRQQAPAHELKLQEGQWTVAETLPQQAQPARKSPRKSATALSGKTIYAAEFYQNTSGERTLNDGGLVSFAYSGSTASVKGLGSASNKLTMNCDLEAGTVSVTPQVVYNHSTYGGVYICPIDWSTRQISLSTPITGTIDEKGNITLGAYGLFVLSGNSVAGSFLLTKGSQLHASNARMTNAFHQNPDSLEIYQVYIEQQFDNQIGIVNFAGNGPEVSVYVNTDQSVEITPQHIYTNATYGEFVCKPADWSGKGILSGSLSGTSTPSLITLGNWAIVNRAYSNLVAYYYESSKIELTDFTLTYPKPRTLTWTGDGTQTSPYTITTAEQMQELAESVGNGTDYAGKYFTMGNDIDMSAITSAYRSIGRSEEKSFKGNFNGAGHTLRNLTITYGQESYAGIFGSVGQGAVITNFTVDSLSLTSAGQYAGGAVAYATGASISNIKVTNSTITHTNSYCGGVVGDLTLGTVSDCSFTGTITGAGATGGVAGILRGSKLSNCHATATMKFNEYYDRFYRSLAGVAGYAMDKRDDAGTLQESYVTDSYFTGTISDVDGHGQVAGIVGNLNGGHVERCFNAAPISTVTTSDLNGCAGGLVGIMNGATVKDCFSANELVSTKGTHQAAGLIGYILMHNSKSSTIESCYNAGQSIVNGGYPTYGVYGVRFSPSYLKNVYYDRQMTSSTMPDSLAWMAKTTSELTTAQGPEGFSTDVWTFTEGYYPVLTQFKDVPAAQMAICPLFLNGEENVDKIKSNFKGAVRDGLKWRIYTSGGFTTDGTGLSVADDGTFTLKNVSANEMIALIATDGTFKVFNVATVDPAGFVGTGTEKDPYLIQDKEDLVALNTYIVGGQTFEGEYFKQTKDIDLNYADDFKGVGDDNTKTHLFNATYDGQNFSIRRMKIGGVTYGTDGKAVSKESRSTGGLFGFAGANSLIKNVVIAADCKIEVYSKAGGVVGSTQGVVENCRNYADITTITNYAGGIAGEVAATGTVRHCYNAGTITAGSNNAGGISASTSGTVEYCQNDGEVRAIYLTPTIAETANNTVGGIASSASYTTAVLRSNVNTGYVHSRRDVGGITSTAARAKEMSGNLNYGIVEYTFNNGSVGALLGTSSTNSAFSGNVFDSQLGYQGASAFVSSTGCTGLTTAELISGKAISGLSADYFDYTPGQYPVLKAFTGEAAAASHRQMVVLFGTADNTDNISSAATLATVKGLDWALTQAKDFQISGKTLTVTPKADTLSMRDTLTLTLSGYTKVIPLRAIPTLFEGQGTAANPFLIKTVADMQTLGKFTTNELCSFQGRHFLLVNDLDFTDQTYYPVAKSPATFAADFNGNGKSLQNVVYTSEADYEALFSNVAPQGTIRDLTLASGTITANRYLGGIAGRVYGKVTNCTNRATVTTPKNGYAGGIASQVYAGGVIENCVNEGTISPKGGYAGGIVNNAGDGSLIKGCVNKADMKDLSTMAGIAAQSTGTIIDCVNKGTISGTTYLAGIVARATAGDSVINCVNEGIVKGTSNIGGIVAYTNTSSTDISSVFIGCSNTAAVSGASYVGGVAGYARVGAEFYDCHNTADVTSTGSTAGGFIGYAYSASANLGHGVAERCYNTGKVTSSGKDVGGFVGNSAAKFTFTDCYNTGDVISTQNEVGGFAGLFQGVAEKCYNAGNVTSAGYGVGGFAGISRGGSITACYNVGDVTSTGTTVDGSHGNAGGLVGEGYTPIRNSFNMGNVSAKAYAAGLLGMATSSSASISCSYNAGKVTAETEGTAGAIQMAGKKYVATVDSVFFDNEFCTGVPDSTGIGRTTIQMQSAALGDGFVYKTASYPLPAAFENSDTACVYVAAYKLAEGETAQEVKSDFTVAVPQGITWTGSENLQISGSDVRATTIGAATLTKTFGAWSRTFNLNIAKATGINTVSGAGNILSRAYFSLSGAKTTAPAIGEVVVEQTVYTDGTSATRKVVYTGK